MDLTERDRLHIWHPYTQHKTSKPPIAIVKGEGALLWDDSNKEYIDATITPNTKRKIATTKHETSIRTKHPISSK